MDDKRLVKTSKYLARHLRHQPERLGLTLDEAGWVDVDTLLRACSAQSFPLTRAQLNEVVEKNDKRRFSFDPSGTKIRASQGHSVEVDLHLQPVDPPVLLFHGTSAPRIASILREGLHRGRRHHVHLSPDTETARRVGARHGRPVVLEVAAAEMSGIGFEFLTSDNGVWLTAEVPPRFLKVLS